MAFPAIIPIVLFGGAVAYVATKKPKEAGSKKPNGATKAKMINKGSYRYSSDCQEFWVAGVDIAKMKPGQTIKNPSAEQFKNINKFLGEAMAAVAAEDKFLTSVNTNWDDRSLWLWEMAMGIVGRLAPECAVAGGRPISPVASALMTIAFAVMTEYFIERGEKVDEVIKEVVVAVVVVFLEIEKIGGKDITDPRFDMIEFIKRVRKNPEKYKVSDADYNKFMSAGIDNFLERFNMNV